MKALSLFYPYLLPELPGISDPMLDSNMLQVAREFLDRAKCWQDNFPTITAQDDTLTYFIVPAESNTDLVQVLRLTVDGALQWSAADPPEGNEQPAYPADLPPFVIDSANEQITLDEQPAGDIEIFGVMRPAMNATSLPDLLLNDHLEGFRAGVLARLMAMGNQPWTDRPLSAHYADIYARKTNVAATRARGGNTRKPLRTRAWG